MSTLWFKDVIIYQTHVKAFFDSNDDGVGDFGGLIRKLDYLQDLGINALWVLPFYPSPLRDDGYDIASYKGINPMYGTMRDFRVFVREAHRRNIRVITELVINHTSDQHPWFQVARKSPPGSARRNRYVWSDNDRKYRDARIIFTDSETSNWSWDPVAKAYYWHRFFHHQPDLNFDNPAVLREIIKVLRFWLDQGVDGLRLDAIPYLVEREGTNCENLPETHTVLREIRREVDLHYGDRMLLAEANQWPSDVRPYFGDGNECHMAFHFPLMPRMFMAIRQEDRHPITDILRQTPDIPDSCQWALFLRNHDELTLEMVTDEERDYMYRAYAADPRMRINIGIRRRLAPLTDNSRRRIELLNSLLFSLRGTPILYYGDEIGMGDNIYLGDRNGVRTPMQWNADRNAGFSRADFAKLYSPPIMDTVYGYQAINVEAQQRNPSSLLHWMKRMIALRNRHQVFGRGTTEFILPNNRKVLVYIRKYEESVILCVANLSRYVQPVELDLSAYAGLTPVEMMGRIEFPPITEAPYFLSLGPHNFYWFELLKVPESISLRIEPAHSEEPQTVPLVEIGQRLDSMTTKNIPDIPAAGVFPPFLMRQRWYAGKAMEFREMHVEDRIFLMTARPLTMLNLVRVEFSGGESHRYALPLTIIPAESRHEKESLIARVRSADGDGLLLDAMSDDVVCTALLLAIGDRLQVKTRNGVLAAVPTSIFQQELRSIPTPVRIKRGLGEQSNTSVLFGDRLVLKLFRKLEAGLNPDFEILRYLTEKTTFDRTPRLAGFLEYRPREGNTTTLGVLQTFVPNQGNAWNHTLEELARFFERTAGIAEPPAVGTGKIMDLAAMEPPGPVVEALHNHLEQASLLGARTAELHLALAGATDDEAMRPEPFSSGDLNALSERLVLHGQSVLLALEQALPSIPAPIQGQAARLVQMRETALDRLRAPSSMSPGFARIRVHGDYHLGQVLWSKNDFYIIDFEGEPSRTLEERRSKQSPLKDVAGMLRSLSYAARMGLMTFTMNRPQDLQRMERWAQFWEDWTSASFVKGYLATAAGASFLPSDPAQLRQLVYAFLMDKALYEIHYELNNRPDWIQVPLAGMEGLLRDEAL